MQRCLWIRAAIIFILLAILLSLSTPALENKLIEIKDKAAKAMETLSFEKIIELFTSNILKFSKQLTKSFSLCVGVILVGSVFSIIKPSFCDSENLFELFSGAFVVLSVFSPLISCFIKTQEHIESICGFMVTLIPTCVLLHTASGNTLSAALMSSATGSVITIFQTVSVSAIIPLTKAYISIVTANTLCRNSNLASLSCIIKNICLWITGLSFTLFTGILSLQSILQSGADTLAMKGLKYGAARLIPIAGSMVSESMKTVLSGVGYIKSVTGISGIIFIIYALIPPLCFILMTKLYLSLLSYFAKLADSHHVTYFLQACESTANILLSLLLSCSVSLIIILTIFIKTTTQL